mmetsp:Transcript_27086/g.59567  ORF Transcript_27086/g.59567 Transcript_27086/m.59567 type:complete len:128 (-) Transcript_27086:1507-1890(-)
MTICPPACIVICLELSAYNGGGATAPVAADPNPDDCHNPLAPNVLAMPPSGCKNGLGDICDGFPPMLYCSAGGGSRGPLCRCDAINPFDDEAIEGSGVDESEEDAEIALFASPTNGGGDCIRPLLSS